MITLSNRARLMAAVAEILADSDGSTYIVMRAKVTAFDDHIQVDPEQDFELRDGPNGRVVFAGRFSERLSWNLTP
jgi:hypothetical protein